MYINVGVNTPENKVGFNLVEYDYDANPLLYWDYGTTSAKRIDQASTSNYGVKSYTLMKQDGSSVAGGAICLFSDRQMYSAPSAHAAEVTDVNKAIVDGLGFGMFNSEQDCIIPKVISFTNRVSGEGFSSSTSSVEYTEVTPTETAPENWETECRYAYFLGADVGTGVQQMYAYRMINPSNYDWDTLYAFLQNNPSYKLYKNTELSKRIFIGDDEHCVSFSVTKADCGPGTSYYAYPTADSFYRNANVRYPKDAGGIMIAGDGDTSDYQMWTTLGSPWDTNGWNYPLSGQTGMINPFYTSGRLSSSAPATKANPVTECTLLQFGQVKYGGITYTGVWRITYMPAFYWGYESTNSADKYNPTSWATLSNNAVAYNQQMNKSDCIYSIRFFGVDLSEVDVPVDVKEGDIPKPPTPGPQGGAYAYPSAGHPFWETESFGTLANPNSYGMHIYYMTAAEFQAFSGWVFYFKNKTWAIFSEVQEAITAGDDDEIANLLGLGEILSGAVSLSALRKSNVDIESCILFCRKMPAFIKNERDVTNTWGVHIGGLTYSNIKPAVLYNERIVDTVRYEFGSDTTATSWQTGTYFDLDPYVTARLFLPYYGDLSLPVDSFIGGSIVISYCADIISGKGGILVICTDHNGEEVTFGPFECDVTANIPLFVADANANNRISAITGAATSTVISALRGNATGAASTAATGVVNALMMPKIPEMIGTFGSNNGFITPTQIMLQLTYPQTLDDKDAQHNLDATIANIGCTSYQNGKVSDFLTGKITRFSYVNTDGISAVDAEKRAIELMLKEGVY